MTFPKYKKNPWRYIPRRCFCSTSSTSLTFAKTSDGDGCSKSVITDSKRMMMRLGWLSTTAEREGQDIRGLRMYFSSICPEKLYEHSWKITRIYFYIKVCKKKNIYLSLTVKKKIWHYTPYIMHWRFSHWSFPDYLQIFI